MEKGLVLPVTYEIINGSAQVN